MESDSGLIAPGSLLWLPDEWRFKPTRHVHLDADVANAAWSVRCPVCCARRQSPCMYAQQFAVTCWVPHDARIAISWAARAHARAEQIRRTFPPSTRAPRTWFLDFFGRR